MNNRWLSALVVSVLTHYSASAYADSFVISDIRIQGLQRITEGTVLNYLPVHVGDELPDSATTEVIKALFETGFFQDISLEREGDILVINLVERPTIGKITVSGNKDITADNLLTTLKTSGLSEGYVFDLSTLEQVRNELERLYFSHGKYGVKVETQVEEQDKNRVCITITIDEGQAAHIKAINIVGNQQFSTSTLLKNFTLSPTNITSWVLQADQYDKQKLSADLEALRTFYLDRGYLNFQIISTQVSITPDKQDIYITINIEEGCQFTLDAVSLAGDTILPVESLMPLVCVKEGEIFSRSKAADTVRLLQDRLGQEGYAFAKVNPVPDIHDADKTVSLSFYVEPGNKIYVRRVLFEGNTKTKDEVIRREFVQMESALFNMSSIEESRLKLNRTGYFTDVKSDIRPVPGTTDQIDVVFVIEEAQAGQLGGGVGYSDSDGLLFNANVTNRNFMGSGNSLDFSFNKSKAYTTYNLSYTNPYYTPEGISRGFNIFYSKTDEGKGTNITNYSTDAVGANISYGIPISRVDRLTYGYGVQSTHLGFNEATVPLQINNFINIHGPNSQEVNFAFGWSHNTLDRLIFPQNGLQQSFGITTSLPGARLQYYRLSYNHQWYKHLGGGFVLTSSALLGFGGGYGKTHALPFYKNFFAGGIRTIRGFQESSLGPKDSLGNPFGGNLLTTASIGVVIPNFLMPDLKSVRFAWFVDAGQVFSTIAKSNPEAPSAYPSGFRYSTGLSATWISPIAPMVFSIAVPLNRHPGDRVQYPAFTFGTVY